MRPSVMYGVFLCCISFLFCLVRLALFQSPIGIVCDFLHMFASRTPFPCSGSPCIVCGPTILRYCLIVLRLFLVFHWHPNRSLSFGVLESARSLVVLPPQWSCFACAVYPWCGAYVTTILSGVCVSRWSSVIWSILVFIRAIWHLRFASSWCMAIATPATYHPGVFFVAVRLLLFCLSCGCNDHISIFRIRSFSGYMSFRYRRNVYFAIE